MSLPLQLNYPPAPGQILTQPGWPDLHSADGHAPLLDRAMALAKVGAWSCNLSDEKLSWTAGIYDLFGLPRGSPLDRRQIVDMYTEESLEEMERLRTQAIARCGKFTLDAQIVRPDGDRRWMRLTGEVVRGSGRTPRLHGLKQDITEERARLEAMRQLAENDALTGLANRAVFEARFLARTHSAAPVVPLGALVLFDLDGFKNVNDRFGHAAGDSCLRAFAGRLSASFPEALLTARIGGDEFAMIVDDVMPADVLRAVIARFLAKLRAPILWRDQMFTIAASTGVAVPPDPYRYDPEELFVKADAALYAAKRTRRRVGDRIGAQTAPAW